MILATTRISFTAATIICLTISLLLKFNLVMHNLSLVTEFFAMIKTVISNIVEACTETIIYNLFVGGCEVIVKIISISENMFDFGNGMWLNWGMQELSGKYPNLLSSKTEDIWQTISSEDMSQNCPRYWHLNFLVIKMIWGHFTCSLELWGYTVKLYVKKLWQYSNKIIAMRGAQKWKKNQYFSMGKEVKRGAAQRVFCVCKSSSCNF